MIILEKISYSPFGFVPVIALNIYPLYWHSLFNEKKKKITIFLRFEQKKNGNVTRNIRFTTTFSSHTLKSIMLVANYKTDNK